MRRVALLVLVLAGLLSVTLIAEARCGRERWAVKTGTDRDAHLVDTSVHNVTRISAMRSWPAPDHPPSTKRVAPHELKVWVIDATLTAYKMEDDPNTGDSDYHLVLADESGNTIIAEIPSPSCVKEESPFFEAITDAREKFDAMFHATGQFQDTDTLVRVVGVGFFDFHHGQRGVAPNAVELHPVLDIIFDPVPQQLHELRKRRPRAE
jgi:hypothetical protein